MIRPLEAHDLDLYRAIRTEALRTDPDAFGETLEAFLSRSAEDRRTRFARHVGSTEHVILVEVTDGVPRAMCGCGRHHADPRDGYLWGMFVSPSARRRGIGLALLYEAVRFLEPLGLRRIRARVAAPNEDALAFYRRAGFTVEPATETLREGSDIPVHPIELPLGGQAEAP